MIFLLSLCYYPTAHASIADSALAILPDAARDVWNGFHSLEFAFDFYRKTKSVLSKCYLNHLIADKFAHVNSSVIKGPKHEHKLARLAVDTIVAINLSHFEMNATEAATEFYDFVQQYKTKVVLNFT